MAKIEDLQDNYAKLDKTVECSDESKIDVNCLLTFDYEYPNNDAEVKIDTDEFTAVCPWTGLPDFGTVTITYIPNTRCIELKSLKFYLMSYSGVGIVQEHVVNRILNDLVSVSKPKKMSVNVDYNIRGGIHTTVSSDYKDTNSNQT